MKVTTSMTYEHQCNNLMACWILIFPWLCESFQDFLHHLNHFKELMNYFLSLLPQGLFPCSQFTSVDNTF